MDHKEIGPSFFSESEVRSPLADPLQARRLLESLPVSDPLLLLRQATAWLDELIGLPAISLEHLFYCIDRIELAAKPHQLHLLPEYLGTPRQAGFMTSPLGQASFAFWAALARAYQNCLARFQGEEGDFRAFQAQLPRVCCRTLRCLSWQQKWTYFRYAPVDAALWRDLGHAFQLAEGWGFAGRHGTVYSGRHGDSSPQEELLKALMLAISSPDALPPLKLELAERLIGHLRHRFAFHTTPGPGCQFCFDLAMHRPPQRAHKSGNVAVTQRFFGPGTAQEALNELLAHVEKHGKAPESLGLGEHYDANLLSSLIRHLARCWSDHPFARRGRREPSLTRFTVVPGLSAAIEWLDQLAEPAGQLVDAAAWESWIVSDVSEHGCGAQLDAGPPGWLEIGALVGLRSEASRISRMGIVRRLSAAGDGIYRVGIEFVGSTAVPVLVQAASRDVDTPAVVKRGIVLERTLNTAGEIELLLAPDDFLYVDKLRLQWKSQAHEFRQARPIAQGKDYRQAVFAWVKPAGATAESPP